MPVFKEQITEEQAAAQFVLSLMHETKNAWPNVYKSLRDTYKDKFAVENETMAIFDLSLAVLAQEVQALGNLFSREQAERIYKWVLRCIDSPEYGEYARREVEEYREVFQKASKNIQAGENALEAIPTRLLHRWLGKNIRNFEIEISSKKTGIMSPLLVLYVTEILISFTGKWKRIKENFKLTKGDLPL